MDDAQLRTLHNQMQTTLTKFLGPEAATSPALKESLEAQLQQFRQQPYAVNVALTFIKSSQDQLVLWYSASLLESHVLEKWQTTDPTTAARVRQTVLSTLISRVAHPCWTAMVKDKILSIICVIGLRDYPEKYANFFSDVWNLVQTQTTFEVGTRLVRFIFEEFPLSSTKRGSRKATSILSSKRVEQLANFMQKTAAKFVPMLQGILHNPAKEARAGADALRALDAVCDTAPESVAKLMMSGKLLELLFRYLNPKVSPQQGSNSTDVVGPRQNAGLALQVLSTIVTRQCLPTSGEQKFVGFVAMQVLGVLHYYVTTKAALAALDSEFLIRLVDFISAFLSNHYHRMCTVSAVAGQINGGKAATFPIERFLDLILQLTCSADIDIEVFEICLEPWNFLLEEYLDVSSLGASHNVQPAVASDLAGATAPKASHTRSPAQARLAMQPLLLVTFQKLAPIMLQRTFFQYNSAQLETLDDTPSDASHDHRSESGHNKSAPQNLMGYSDLDKFVGKVIKLCAQFAQVAELGSAMLTYIAPQFHIALKSFNTCAGATHTESVGRILHDVAAALQLLCCVSGHFVHNFERYFSDTLSIATLLLHLAEYCTTKRIYSQGIGFRRVQRGVLIALQHNCGWLEMFAEHLQSQKPLPKHASKEQLAAMITKLAGIVVGTLNCSIFPVPQIILEAALGLMRSAAITFHHVPLLLISPKLRALCDGALAASSALPLETKPSFFTAIAFLILNSKETGEAGAQHKYHHLCKNFFGSFVSRLQEFNPMHASVGGALQAKYEGFQRELLRSATLSEVQSKANIAQCLFRACVTRNSAPLTSIVASSFAPVIQLFTRFMPCFLFALKQSSVTPDQLTGIQTSGATSSGFGVQPAPRQSTRSSVHSIRKLPAAVKAVMAALAMYTELHGTRMGGASRSGASRVKSVAKPSTSIPETILIPLGSAILTEAALTSLISNKTQRFIIADYVKIVSLWFLQHKKRSFPKHTLDIVLQIEEKLWPLLQHPAYYADVTDITMTLCGLLRTLLMEHLSSLSKKGNQAIKRQSVAAVVQALGGNTLFKASASNSIATSKSTTKGTEVPSKGHRIIMHAVQILIAIASNTRSPPAVIQSAIQAMEAAQGRHKLFSHPHLQVGIRQALIAMVFNILLQGRALLLQEDLLKLLFVVAQADGIGAQNDVQANDAFYQMHLPHYLRGLRFRAPIQENQQKVAALLGILTRDRQRDRYSFSRTIMQFVGDCRQYLED